MLSRPRGVLGRQGWHQTHTRAATPDAIHFTNISATKWASAERFAARCTPWPGARVCAGKSGGA